MGMVLCRDRKSDFDFRQETRIKKNLKQARKMTGLTGKELAAGAGIHPSQISKFENYGKISAESLKKIADYWGVYPNLFLLEPDEFVVAFSKFIS